MGVYAWVAPNSQGSSSLFPLAFEPELKECDVIPALGSSFVHSDFFRHSFGLDMARKPW